MIHTRRIWQNKLHVVYTYVVFNCKNSTYKTAEGTGSG